MSFKEKVAKSLLAPYLKGNRKLLAFLVYVGSVVGIACFGNLENFSADTALQWGFGFFVGGNVGEHAANGRKKKGEKDEAPEEKDSKAAGESGRGRIGMLLFVLFIIAAIAVIFTPKAEAGVLDYIDPQAGTGLEFLEVKGSVITGTARAFQGKDKIDWLSIRIGALLGDGMEPGLICGPFADLATVTRGKLDWMLGYVQADVGLFGGVLYDPGEEKESWKGLFGIGVVLVSR